MAILDLRRSPPPDVPAADRPVADEVESVREMLESGEPPGLDRIRRFVLKPRPRLWKFGVGIWLWVKRFGLWLMRLLRWMGKNARRLARAARLAAFLGRRSQNLGARIGAVGRNWSSAEGRLGAMGGWLARFGERLVRGGASLAQVGEGVTELTKRATGFLADAPSSGSETANGGEGVPPGTLPTPPPAGSTRRRAARGGPARRPPAGRSGPAARSGPAPAGDGAGGPAAPPAPTRAAAAAARPAEETRPASAAADPSPLPADLPFYLRNQVEHLGKRPRRERVEHLILALTEHQGWMEPGQLAEWLGTTAPYLARRYLGPMTEAGQLVRKFPNRPTHPDQAYRSAQGGDAPRS